MTKREFEIFLQTYKALKDKDLPAQNQLLGNPEEEMVLGGVSLKKSEYFRILIENYQSYEDIPAYLISYDERNGNFFGKTVLTMQAAFADPPMKAPLMIEVERSFFNRVADEFDQAAHKAFRNSSEFRTMQQAVKEIKAALESNHPQAEIKEKLQRLETLADTYLEHKVRHGMNERSISKVNLAAAIKEFITASRMEKVAGEKTYVILHEKDRMANPQAYKQNPLSLEVSYAKAYAHLAEQQAAKGIQNPHDNYAELAERMVNKKEGEPDIETLKKRLAVEPVLEQKPAEAPVAEPVQPEQVQAQPVPVQAEEPVVDQKEQQAQEQPEPEKEQPAQVQPEQVQAQPEPVQEQPKPEKPQAEILRMKSHQKYNEDRVGYHNPVEEFEELYLAEMKTGNLLGKYEGSLLAYLCNRYTVAYLDRIGEEPLDEERLNGLDKEALGIYQQHEAWLVKTGLLYAIMMKCPLQQATTDMLIRVYEEFVNDLKSLPSKEIIKAYREQLERDIKAAEEEAKQKAEEAKKREAEEAAKREAQEKEKRLAEERERIKAAEEARRRAEEEARKREEEENRRKAEEEKARQKAEEEARKAEEERLKAEEEARKIAEEEAEKNREKTPEELRQMELEGEYRYRRDLLDRYLFKLGCTVYLEYAAYSKEELYQAHAKYAAGVALRDTVTRGLKQRPMEESIKMLKEWERSEQEFIRLSATRKFLTQILEEKGAHTNSVARISRLFLKKLSEMQNENSKPENAPTEKEKPSLQENQEKDIQKPSVKGL